MEPLHDCSAKDDSSNDSRHYIWGESISIHNSPSATATPLLLLNRLLWSWSRAYIKWHGQSAAPTGEEWEMGNARVHEYPKPEYVHQTLTRKCPMWLSKASGNAMAPGRGQCQNGTEYVHWELVSRKKNWKILNSSFTITSSTLPPSNTCISTQLLFERA